LIAFALSEGWRSFRNLGILGLLTILSLTVTLTLVGLSLRGYLLIEGWSRGLLGRFEIEVFLSPEIDSLRVTELTGAVAALPEVGTVVYISREEAARRFSEQFGDELLDLLEFNPLPLSLVVTLSGDADPEVSWDRVARTIATLDGVDDVVYQGDLLARVSSFYRSAGVALAAAVGAALILSLIFTTLSVHAAIRSREEFIRIVSLSGGSKTFVRAPFIVLGGYYGVVSGLIAAGASALLLWMIGIGWNIDAALPVSWGAAQVLAGVCVGMVGAGLVAGRRISSV